MSHLAHRVCLPVLLGLALTVLGPGCRGSTEHAMGGVESSTEYTTGGVKVRVLHPPSGGSHSQGVDQDDYSWTHFEWKDTKYKPFTVVVDHLRLW